MICAWRLFSCSGWSGSALEPLFGACPANDLVALAEPQTRLLEPERMPELLESLVDLLDLRLHSRIQAEGKPVPELLAILGQALDFRVDLVRGHEG